MDQKYLLAFRIKSLNNQIRRRLERGAIAENKANLTGMQYAILAFIDEWPKESDVYQRDIEAEFNIRRSTASAMVRQLEMEDYLYRVPVPGDARLKKIVLTPKAEENGRAARRSMEQLQARLTQNVSAEELRQFYATLDKIQRNLEE